MSAPPRPLPNTRCPLCGEPNDCAPAACGTFDVACWCASVRIEPEMLALVPSAQRGIACLCRQCALRRSSPDRCPGGSCGA
ncbi:MAG TPA: cysteine-rich CWC family protein [Burkholderiaceae bacterium]|nr:cysteine-rich CWC family protein [Burkholderiaceae bacterium]